MTMIVMKTVGGDVCQAELAPGLVLWLRDTCRGGRPKRAATPDALDGNGAQLYRIIHATDEERAMLREAGVKMADADFKWLEAHNRPGRRIAPQPPGGERDEKPQRKGRKATRAKRTMQNAAANVVPLVRVA